MSNPFSGKSYGVMGLGKAGAAAVERLLSLGAYVYAWDDSEQARNSLPNHAHIQVNPYIEWDFSRLEAMLLSPGIPLTHPAPHKSVKLAKADDCPIIGDIELLYRINSRPTYIGITGTNGKSTTTALIGHIFKEVGISCEVGGNLGKPALSFDDADVYIIEASSYQLDLLDKAIFNIAALLNITPDHLDRHGGMEGYVAAKQRICSGGSQDDVGVICIDDSYAVAMYQELQTSDRKLIAVSTKQSIPQGVYVDNGVLTDQDQHFPIDQFEHLPGAHNAQNIAVAYVVCRAYGIEGGSIIKAVSSFGGLDHRLQIVGKYGNVSFVNDSKATNAEATSHALKAFDEIYWIVGGKAKEGGIDSLSPYFSNIRHAFLIGEAASEFANTLEGSVAYTSSGDLEAATVQAFAKASEKGGVVLLSPACASFDQWPSFEARGEAFCQYVSALQHEAA